MAVDMIRIDREMGIQPDGSLAQRYIIQVGFNKDLVATEEGFLVPAGTQPEFSEVVEFLQDALADLIQANEEGKSFTKMP